MAGDTSLKISFRVWLMLLSAFASLPMIFFSIFSLISLMENQRNNEQEHMNKIAISIANEIDRNFVARVAMLTAVANGDSARNDDLEALYAHASRLISNVSCLHSISLIDRNGNILFNTLNKYGEVLPKSNEQSSVFYTIKTSQPNITAKFKGAISHKPIVAIDVPVFVLNKIKYILRSIISIHEFNVILRQKYLPKGWSIAVFSGDIPIAHKGPLFDETTSKEMTDDVFIFRTKKTIETAGDNNLIETAFVKVGNWGWSVAVSVPETAFVKPLRLMLFKFGVAGIICLFAGVAASYWLACRLSRDISGIAAASETLASDQPSFDAGTIIREMGEVRACLLAAKDREQQAMADPLTGLPGRTRFWNLAGELEEKSRSDAEVGLAVMFIDLDGFKEINDRYGHDRGDQILCKAAAVIRESTRDSDVVGRLGGDEFAVCMIARKGRLIPAATSIADRIVRMIHEIGEGVGCSIGISVCETEVPDLSRSLKLADKAMYEAKRSGKNHYVIHKDKIL